MFINCDDVGIIVSYENRVPNSFFVTYFPRLFVKDKVWINVAQTSFFVSSNILEWLLIRKDNNWKDQFLEGNYRKDPLLEGSVRGMITHRKEL